MQHSPADRVSRLQIYRRVKTPNRTGTSSILYFGSWGSSQILQPHNKNPSRCHIFSPCTFWVTIEYVFKICLAKIGFNIVYCLDMACCFLGSVPTFSAQLLPPPFRAIRLQGYSAYVFPNLFQTWLRLRCLFLLLRSFSDWRLLQSDENHLKHSLLLTTWQAGSALYWSLEDAHLMATSSTTDLSVAPMKRSCNFFSILEPSLGPGRPHPRLREKHSVRVLSINLVPHFLPPQESRTLRYHSEPQTPCHSAKGHGGLSERHVLWPPEKPQLLAALLAQKALAVCTALLLLKLSGLCKLNPR